MRRLSTALLTSAVLALLVSPALSAIAGYTEDFNAGLGGWGGGATLDVITSGGVGGVGDGYLLVSNENPAQLATRNNSAPYTGDLIADGITGVSFWLNDLGGSDTLRLHVAIGNPGNFWTTAVEFSPSASDWTRYEVDLTDAGAWVRQQGSGTFEDALRTTDRVQFRNNPLPGDAPPSDGVADFALDRITLVPAPGGLATLLAFGAIAGRRRR